MKWITDPDDYENAPIDGEMYIITEEYSDGSRTVDYCEFHRGEWCTSNKVIAWVKIEPYDGEV